MVIVLDIIKKDGDDDIGEDKNLGVGDAVRLPSVNGSPMPVLT